MLAQIAPFFQRWWGNKPIQIREYSRSGASIWTVDGQLIPTAVLDWSPMHKLMVIGIEGKELVARSPVSEIELARVAVKDQSTVAHILAGFELIQRGFHALNAEGFERAKVE